MCDNFKYKAFISYNSKDVKWGKRLQRRLEWYITPIKMWKKHLTLRPLSPVFFAPTDIEIGELKKEIKDKLSDSANLIVICSPNAAQSEWVGKEIKFFIELGRLENIHFFIVNGEPNSVDRNKECFHPIIKELGLNENLGANIHERNYFIPMRNRERAYTQIISKLLGVSFNDIWKRHTKVIINLAISVLLLITLLLFIVSSINKSKLTTQAKYIANEADKLAKEGDVYNAVRLMTHLWKNNKQSLLDPNCRYDILGSAVRINQKSVPPILLEGVRIREGRFNVNGKYAFAYSDTIVKIWDVDKKLCILTDTYNKDNKLRSVKFSPAGNHILIESETSKILYLLEDGTCVHYMDLSEYKKIVFSPDRESVLLGSDNDVKLWSLTKDNWIWSNTIEKIDLIGFIFSGKYVITSNNDNIRYIYSAINGQLILSIDDISKYGEILSSPNDDFFIYSSSNYIKLWSVNKKQCVWTEKFKNHVQSLEFSPKGDYVLINKNILYSIKDGVCKPYKDLVEYHKLLFSPNGEYALVYSDTEVKLWSLTKNECIWTRPIEEKKFNIVKFSSNGDYVLLSPLTCNEAKVYSVLDGELKLHIKYDSDPIYILRARFSPNGEYIITTVDRNRSINYTNSSDIWSIDKKTVVYSSKNTILLDISPNDKRIIAHNRSGNNKYVYLSEIEDKDKLKTGYNNIENPYPNANIKLAKITPDGKFLYTIFEVAKYNNKFMYNNTSYHIRIWSFDEWKWLEDDIRINGGVKSIDFDVTGENMLLTDKYDVELWSVKDKKRRYTFYGSAVFSPDGKYLVNAKYNTAKLWLIDSVSCIDTLFHNGTINSTIFSHNGEYILTASNDSTARLWSLRNGKLEKIYYHENPVDTAIFSLNDKYIVTVSGGKNIKSWTIKGRCLRHDIQTERKVKSVSFENSNYVLLSYKDRTFDYWHLRFNYSVEGGKKAILAKYTPDGNYLIKMNGNNEFSASKYYRNFNQNRQTTGIYRLNTSEILDIFYHNDGLYVVQKVSYRENNATKEKIELINIKFIESILNQWSQILGPNADLTKEEKQQYHLN